MTFYANLDAKGRLVLPVKLRDRLGVKEGDAVAISITPGSKATITSVREKLRSLKGMLKKSAAGRSPVQELIAERKREAAQE